MENKYQRNWIVRDTLGIFLVIAVAAGLLSLEGQLLGQPGTGTEKLIGLGFAIVGGLIGGTFLARLQWSILKERYPQISWFKWWRNTVLAITAGWILAIIPSFMYTGSNTLDEVVVPFGIPLFTLEYGSIIFGGVLGGMIGFGQWFELKKHRSNAGQWIGANVFSWAFGIFILAMAGLVLQGSTALQTFLLISLVGGLLAALCIAGFTSMFFGDAQQMGSNS